MAPKPQSVAALQGRGWSGRARPSRWRRLRAWLRPRRRLSITRVGRTYILLTLGVGFGALNTGNNLLYLLLGLLLTVIVMSGVLSERALRGLKIRRLGTAGAFAGEPFSFRWGVTRTAPGACFALVLSEDGKEVAGDGRLPFLTRGQEVIVRGELTAERRGPHRLTAVKVTTTWPMGLFAKTAVIPLEDVLVVFPRRGYACRTPQDEQLGPAGEAGNPRRNDGNGDLLGLRELGENEDARRVHWLKSAAAGKLLRTEREREERRSYVLEVRAPPGTDALEQACEETAALSQRLLLQGHEVGLDALGHRLRPSAGPAQQRRILHALAWLGFEPDEHGRGVAA